MSFNVLITSGFKKDSRRLQKRYKSFKNEIAALISSLEVKPEQGTLLGQGCFKIRVAIGSKNRGKSGGARVITCVKLVQNNVFLLSVYDKADRESISDKERTELLKQIPE